MAFSEETKAAALRRAGYRCECARSTCPQRHVGHCTAQLAGGRWHAHHITAVRSGAPDSPCNCEALCIPCHQGTRTYGA